jgi:polyphenol oxidase
LKTVKKAQLSKIGKSGCYQFRIFRKHKAVAVFSTRRFRINFTPETKESVTLAHRKLFCQLANVSFDQLVCLEQVHGAHIIKADREVAGRGARNQAEAVKGSDASITNEPEIALAIRTADCAPLFFMDTRHRAIGMAHVGWRGASERLASKMVQAFQRQFLSKAADLMVGIGPLIRACCYQVGPEFRNVFGSFVGEREKRHYFDLAGWISEELRAEGISERQVYDSHLCTSCLNKEFPSYRREGEKVRHMWSILMLLPDQKGKEE